VPRAGATDRSHIGSCRAHYTIRPAISSTALGQGGDWAESASVRSEKVMAKRTADDYLAARRCIASRPLRWRRSRVWS